MPLVQVKCTNCGANLEIDNTLDAAVCPYCNVPFVVEKAINNYNTANHISAGPVNAYGGSSADFAVRGGVLEKYNGAAMEVVIPNSVKIIEDQAFSGCRGSLRWSYRIRCRRSDQVRFMIVLHLRRSQYRILCRILEYGHFENAVHWWLL